ncbi:MAG: hypothetical protein AB7O48_06005 [Cyclobacteriaceae bacterium]
MKYTCSFSLLLLSISVSAQNEVTSELLYSLTKRTIEADSIVAHKLLKFVAMPTEVWDSKTNQPRTGAYLTSDDLDTISYQVAHPIFKTWDVPEIRGIKNLKILKKCKGRIDCLTVSLPIVSRDQKAIIIYYKLSSKHSAAGFVAVWKRKPNDEWEESGGGMIWIT